MVRCRYMQILVCSVSKLMCMMRQMLSAGKLCGAHWHCDDMLSVGLQNLTLICMSTIL